MWKGLLFIPIPSTNHQASFLPQLLYIEEKRGGLKRNGVFWKNVNGV